MEIKKRMTGEVLYTTSVMKPDCREPILKLIQDRYKQTMDPKIEKVAIYVRVSTEDQELQHQIENCQRYCNYKNLVVPEIYQDIGSGKSYRNRPGFVKLLGDLRAYKYDGVVIFRLDRLFRNVVEAVNIIQEMENKGIKIYSINENFDTSTAMGRAMMNFALVLAQLERENISEATKARLKILKDDGVVLGRPAISDFQVKKIVELRLTGLSYRQIADEMRIKKTTVAKYCKLEKLGGSVSEKGGSNNTPISEQKHETVL